MAEVGVRVVRGPDWQWGDQDGGEGFCGTVVEVGRPGSASTPDRTVVVHWDIGARTNYRVGYQSAYDLRLLDNAPVGVKHANHICDGCKKQGIFGLQWSCIRCYDYDLCTVCYMADKHDTSHPFRRHDNASCTGIEVPPRKNSTKVPLQGIFVGAKVVRGPDWDWGNQDGGTGEFGKVTEIRGWDGESSRSVASVVWGTSGVNNVYRLGHKGKVDLKCEQAATCGYIYINHLPVLGRSTGAGSSSTVGAAGCVSGGSGSVGLSKPPFLVGERVRVCVPLQQLRAMQEGHGGWNHKMAEYYGQTGVVHRITDKGDVRVQYNGCCTRWTIHPSALIRVGHTIGANGASAAAPAASAGGGGGGGHPVAASSSGSHPSTMVPPVNSHQSHYYTPGDRVTVIADEERVKAAQKGHGEWIDYMRAALGKTGVVAKVYPDGDLRVNVDGKTWTFSPSCVTPIATATVNYDDKHSRHYGAPPHHDTHHHHTTDDTPIMNTALQLLPALHPSDSMLPCDLPCGGATVSAMQGLHSGTGGGVSSAQSSTNSRLVDKLVREAAQGHLQAINAILATNPELLECGCGGKTALQVACHQGHLAVVRFLLDRGAHTTTQDQDGDTPLHYAAFGNQVEVLEQLIRRGAAINAVNCGRCTALHVAVNKQHPACVTLLLHYNADANIQDSYGDTALHDAIGKDSVEIVEALTNWPRLNLTRHNNRGFNVLHHAALKGNNYATEKLVSRGRQYVDVRKDDGFAALHLACLNGHRHVAETLLVMGRADPNLANNKRQTPLLLAIAQGHVNLVELLVVQFCADLTCADEDGETALHLTLHKLNQQGKTPAFTSAAGPQGMLDAADGRTANANNAATEGDAGAESSMVGGSNAESNHPQQPLWAAASADSGLDPSSTPVLSGIISGLSPGSSVWLGVACLLVQRGASVAVLNSRGESPLQAVTDLGVLQALQAHTTNTNTQDPSGAGTSNATRLDLDMKALDLAAESLRLTVLEAHHNIFVAESGNATVGGVGDTSVSAGVGEGNHVPLSGALLPSSVTAASAGSDTNPFSAYLPLQQPPPASSSGAPNAPLRSTSQPASPARYGGGGAMAAAGAAAAAGVSASQPASPAHGATATSQQVDPGSNGSSLCIICLECAVSVRFEPCGHSVTCEECAARVKKCLHCHQLVSHKIRHADGHLLSKQSRLPSSDRLRYLESKIADIEEAHCCGICMERRRSVAFLCGHSACTVCAHTLTTCHMCRKPITNKINLY